MTGGLEERLADRLRREFLESGAEASANPLLNPVQAMASRLFLSLERGALTVRALRAAIDDLERASFEARAAAFHGWREEGAAPSAVLDATDFESFRRGVEATPVGVVFTAHPTFSMNPERRALLAQYRGADLADWRARLAAAPAGPTSEITLDSEHQHVLGAIGLAQTSIASLVRRILVIARERFPGRWRSLRPAPASVASWVGYDLDGRTDIHWGQSVTIRLREKAAQLDRYGAALDDIIAGCDDSRLVRLQERFARAAAFTHECAAKFAGDLADPETAVAAANFLTGDHDGRLTSLRDSLDEISHVIDESDEDTALQLSVLRSEMSLYGLGVGRIHLRVNAAQVRSALRTDLGLDPDKDFRDRSAMAIASAKLQSLKPRAINFGSVFLEQMTARRQFMLCAQFLKHIDEDTPIRFLIAECEAPATVMGALYLARLYGVDGKLDISPLFETPTALESGGRFLERLLDEPEYRAYVMKRRRMCIQIGYSDSGRFMGQAAASVAAERLQVLFAQALEKAGLPDVDALVFNTHGESMGRGAAPGDFRTRLAHLSTPWVRSRFRRCGIDHAAEFSFQGGEGYLHFETQPLADETIDALWSLATETPPSRFADAFYTDTDYSWDVYRSLKRWQETLFDKADYRGVIFSFAQNLLFKTGSRGVKRPKASAGPPEIRTIRAIPHNAILQQLGMPVNVSGGLGAASGRETERFIEFAGKSERMSQLLRLCGRARDLTSVTVLRAYAGVFSPSYWSALAGMARHSERADAYESVLQSLQLSDVEKNFSSLANYVARDLRRFDDLRAEMNETSRGVNGAGVEPDFGVLHAIRQALIARAAAVVASTPAFSRRHDIDRVEIIQLALNLRLDEVTAMVERIFPKESPAGDLMAALTEPVDDDHAQGGAYPEIHAHIIEPLTEVNAALGTVTAALVNHYGAFG